MTNRTRTILINLLGLTLAAPAAIAAPGDGLNFRPTVGDFGINYGAAANSVNVMSSGLGATMATHIGNAMAEDPKAFCNDVGVGQTSRSNNSSLNKASSSTSFGKGGGGAVVDAEVADGGSEVQSIAGGGDGCGGDQGEAQKIDQDGAGTVGHGSLGRRNEGRAFLSDEAMFLRFLL